MSDIIVSFDGDSIGAVVGKMRLANDEEGVRKVSQGIDHGNDIIRSWALNNGGSVIEMGGDESAIKVPAAVLGDLPSIRSQYEQAVGATVSVGVGMTLAESSQALLWAKMNGKNRIAFYEPSMQEQLSEALKSLESRPESEKIAAEYLAKDDSPKSPNPQSAPSGHTLPGVFRQGVRSGVRYRKQPKIAGAPGNNAAPEKPHVPRAEHTHAASDYERHFRRLAHGQLAKDKATSAASGPPEDIRQNIVDVLQKVKEAAPTLEALKDQAPDVYEAIRDCVTVMISMAKQISGPETIQKHEASGKSCPKCHSGRVLGKGATLFCPGCKHSAPAEDFGMPIEKAGLPMPKDKPLVVPQPPIGTEKDGKLKIQHGDGSTGWTQVRSGMALGPDNHAVSARKPNTR